MGLISPPLKLFKAVNADPRHWQILALSGLFIMSWQSSDFGATPLHLAMAMTGAMFVQVSATIWLNLRAAARRAGTGEGLRGNHWMRASFRSGWSSAWDGFEWKSAMITSLSLSILLRASSPWLWLAAGMIGIGAKFLVRINRKHVFNPACIGIVVSMLIFGRDAWVSPGQWGQTPLMAGYAIALAALVLSSAKRLDIALAFLGGFAAMLIGRALYLGDPLSIPMHQMQSGALLVFAFFMITDPRSTPDSRLGRIIFALCVAALAAWIGWQFHIRGAMLYALAILAILTPILDKLIPARRFEWRRTKGSETETPPRTFDHKPVPGSSTLPAGIRS